MGLNFNKVLLQNFFNEVADSWLDAATGGE
jgi:hypothetical protein